MAEPRLIADYTAVLLAELPASLGEEVIDGLYEAYGKYLRQGLASEEAAARAVAEFGDPRTVVQAFCRASPARRAAKALIATGPLVGLCWAAELISGRAWDWPLPVIAPVLMGALLASTIAVLVTAARARCYRSVRRSGVAGCAGLAVLDVSMIGVVVAVIPGAGWPAALAICASGARLIGVVRAAGPLLR